MKPIPKSLLPHSVMLHKKVNAGGRFEEDSLDEELMNKAIDQAIAQMNELGIKRKDTTPYLLKTIVELTNGKSLESNIKLVYNNCKLASRIAVKYCQ